MRKILEVRDLVGIYQSDPNSEKIINGISFTIKEKQIVNIVGRNGSGKTTLIKLIAKQDKNLKKISGEILYCETDIDNYDDEEWNLIIGKMYQNPIDGFFTGITCYENLLLNEKKIKKLKLLSIISNRSAKERIKNDIDELEKNTGFNFKYEANKKPKQLSGGQRQLLALLSLYFQKPKILILDEPTASMDKENFENFLRFVEYWIERDKMCAIMVSHGGRTINSRYSKTLRIDEGKLLDE